MKKVKIAELKDQLSRLLREVERGAEVEVTDRDRPIARIVPVTGTGVPLFVIPPKRPFSTLRGKRYPPARWRVSSTVMVQDRFDDLSLATYDQELAVVVTCARVPTRTRLRGLTARPPSSDGSLERYRIGFCCVSVTSTTSAALSDVAGCAPETSSQIRM
jgi:prevent-host-death family protein